MSEPKKRGNPNWIKGKTGNPSGRPKKGTALTDILNQLLDSKNVETQTGDISARQAVMVKLIELAIGGDIQAIKYLTDRVDGSVIAKTEIKTSRPIIFDEVYANTKAKTTNTDSDTE